MNDTLLTFCIILVGIGIIYLSIIGFKYLNECDRLNREEKEMIQKIRAIRYYGDDED